MSFTTISSLSFTRNSTSWDLEFEVWNGSGSGTLNALGGVRRTGDEKLNPMNPVLGSTLDLRLWDKSRTVHDAIVNNDLEDLRITVKKDGTIWHRGLLESIDGGGAIRNDNPELRLTFNDGLPHLKEQNWGEEQERAKLLDILHYFCTDNTRTDLDTRVVLDLQDTQADTSNGRSQALRHQLLYLIGDGNYWDALTAILRYYNMQVMQLSGKWRILHRSARGSSYDYEEKDSGGSVSTGSRSPSVSISDSDLKKEEGKKPIQRPFSRAIGWITTHSRADKDWRNEKFKDDQTQTISGDTVPRGWHLPDTSIFQPSNDQIEIGTNTFNVAEQIWGLVLVNETKSDDWGYQIKGEIDINDTGATDERKMSVAEIIAWQPNLGVKRWWDQSSLSWNLSQTYLKVTFNEDDSNGRTESFDLNDDLLFPPVDGNWMFLLRLTAPEGDVDGDGFPKEVARVRYTSAALEDFGRNAEEPEQPYQDWNALTSNVPDRRPESLSINIHAVRMSGLTQVHPRAGVWFDDSRTGDYEPMHRDSGAEHASRNIGGGSDVSMTELRLRDRHAMTSAKLFAITAKMDRSTVALNDKIDYDGSEWLPHYQKETIGQKVKEVGFTKLLNESVPSDAVEVSEG